MPSSVQCLEDGRRHDAVGDVHRRDGGKVRWWQEHTLFVIPVKRSPNLGKIFLIVRDISECRYL